MDPMAVSVVATVRNEVASIDGMLDSLAQQSRHPDEIVVVDGGSTDGTWERLKRRAEKSDGSIVALSRPGTNISAGRNEAIAAARGPAIACTDAGVTLPRDWLAELARPLDEGRRFVAGFFVGAPHGAFETALGATTLPTLDDVDPARFLPSSRSVAFRKLDWAAVGGYPEWLDYCEDLVFDMRLEHVAGRPVFAPHAFARFRPRPTLLAFVRQYYLYARGDGKADLWIQRHVVRYAAYLVAAPAAAALALAWHPLLWLVPLAGLAAMVARPYARLVRQWSTLPPAQRAAAALWVPVIRVAGDVAKMIGYPVGWKWRLANRPPDWRPSPNVGRR